MFKKILMAVLTLAMFLPFNVARGQNNATCRKVLSATTSIIVEGKKPDGSPFRGCGTGGSILTSREYSLVASCYHVVNHEGITSGYMSVYGSDQKIKYNVIAADEKHDVSVCKVYKSIPSLRMRDRIAELGEPVFGIGTPLGVPFITLWGHISADERAVMDLEFPYIVMDFPILGGMSGSALCDTNGDILGINSNGVGEGPFGTSTHIAMAVPIRYVRELLQRSVK